MHCKPVLYINTEMEQLNLFSDLKLLFGNSDKGMLKLYFRAVQQGHVEIIKQLLELELVQPCSYNFYGLIHAADSYNLPMMELFLSYPKTLENMGVITVQSICNKLMAHRDCALDPKEEKVQAIIIRLMSYLGNFGGEIITAASSKGMTRVVSEWLSSINKDNISQRRDTLHKLMNNRSIRTLKLMLDYTLIKQQYSNYIQRRILILKMERRNKREWKVNNKI